MIINNLDLTDAGQYTCTATNGAGYGTATVTLTVTGQFYRAGQFYFGYLPKFQIKI